MLLFNLLKDLKVLGKCSDYLFIHLLIFFLFRIYLTDATPDNIIIDPKTLKISFIDLDSVIIVDTSENPFSNVTNSVEAAEWHKIDCYEEIECTNCFAYQPDKLYNHYISDMNVYAICQV